MYTRTNAWQLILIAAIGLISGLATMRGRSVATEAQPEAKSKLTGPTDEGRQTARAVAKLVAERHLSARELDQEISRRWLRLFIKRFDSAKVFFTQQDYDEFKKIDAAALLAKGEIDFVYQIHKRYAQRVEERLAQCRVWLAKKHDFTVNEDRATGFDQASFPENEQQTNEAARKYVKHLLMLRRADGFNDVEACERADRFLQRIGEQLRNRDDEALLDSAFNCLTESFDPLSRYISPRAWEDFRIQARQQLIGIGVSITTEDGDFVITRIIPGGPAHKDGRMKARDKITGVSSDGAGKVRDVAGLSLNELVAMIRGQKDTKVKLEIVQEGQSERLLYTLTRQAVETQRVRGSTFNAGTPDAPVIFGYLHVPGLYGEVGPKGKEVRSSTSDTRKVLAEFKTKGVEMVILDMRTNSGGVLSESLSLTDLFIDHGPVLQVKQRDGKISSYEAKDKGAAWDGPMVILTSKHTASGAEIVVGALQSYNRGLVIGEATNGLGTVQTIDDVATGGAVGQEAKQGVLRTTTQQFYRPNGASVQKQGVIPDIVMPWLAVPLPGQAGNDYATDFDRIDALRIEPADFGINQKLRAELAGLSLKRRKASQDFQKFDVLRAQEEERQKRGLVTLNLQKYREDRKAGTADVERFRLVEDSAGTPRDFYFDEAAAIAADFLRLYRQRVKKE